MLYRISFRLYFATQYGLLVRIDCRVLSWKLVVKYQEIVRASDMGEALAAVFAPAAAASHPARRLVYTKHHYARVYAEERFFLGIDVTFTRHVERSNVCEHYQAALLKVDI